MSNEKETYDPAQAPTAEQGAGGTAGEQHTQADGNQPETAASVPAAAPAEPSAAPDGTNDASQTAQPAEPPQSEPAEPAGEAGTSAPAEPAQPAAPVQPPVEPAGELPRIGKKNSKNAKKAERARMAREARATGRANNAPGKPQAGLPDFLADKNLAGKIEKAQAEPPVEDGDAALSQEDRARVETITRTAQLSIEKILEGTAQRGDAADAPPDMPDAELENTLEPPPPPETIARKIGRGVGHGLSSLAKWLLLVAVFIILIAGAGVAWLYKNATPEAIPQFTVSMDGQTLEPTEYKWHVPVIGSVFQRTYAESQGKKHGTLPAEVQTDKPAISVSSASYTTEVTITPADDAKNPLFDGTLDEYKTFTFQNNGAYTVCLKLSNDDAGLAGSAEITGEQTYTYDFTVNIKPTIRINSTAVQEGGVAAVRVSGMPEDSNGQPFLKSDLGEATFVTTASGWIAFLPIPYDQKAGDYTVHVTAGDFEEDLPLAVRARNWTYADIYSKSQYTYPYLSLEDTPAEVKNVLSICDPQVYWTASGFVQPFLTNINIKMNYGAAEYMGRTNTQRARNENVNGRFFTNVVLTCTPYQDLIAPADGRVVLAQDLGGTAGNTVVVEHGAGIKSIFYGLSELSVAEGQIVVQGQSLGKTSETMIGEMRIGEVPVEPLAIWRGQCDATKYL